MLSARHILDKSNILLLIARYLGARDILNLHSTSHMARIRMHGLVGDLTIHTISTENILPQVITTTCIIPQLSIYCITQLQVTNGECVVHAVRLIDTIDRRAVTYKITSPDCVNEYYTYVSNGKAMHLVSNMKQISNMNVYSASSNMDLVDLLKLYLRYVTAQKNKTEVDESAGTIIGNARKFNDIISMIPHLYWHDRACHLLETLAFLKYMTGRCPYVTVTQGTFGYNAYT